MNYISVENATKIYTVGDSRFAALDEVDFWVEQGEYLAITGKSGSGKSTLLNMIGLIDTLDSGSLYLDGKEVGNLKENEKAIIRNNKIGYIFQSFYLEPTYSVMTNVEMPLIIAGVPKKERKERVKALLEQVGMLDKIKNKACELSGGEKQRVCIARALVNDPGIILADEPCGNLDSANASIVLNLLSEFNKKGKTVVLVTHNMDDTKYADRKITMKDGKIV